MQNLKEAKEIWVEWKVLFNNMRRRLKLAVLRCVYIVLNRIWDLEFK